MHNIVILLSNLKKIQNTFLSCMQKFFGLVPFVMEATGLAARLDGVQTNILVKIKLNVCEVTFPE